MAAEVGDTLAPSDTSGSRVYGADTASVEGDNASKSAVDETKEEILRLRVRGFRLGGEKGTTWQKVVILRAGHRKVAIRDQHSLLGRDKEDSLQIDLDDVKLDLYYIAKCQGPPRCTLREYEGSAPYYLEFGALQDVFRFQEIFTGFSVQIHIPDIFVRVRPRYQGRISKVFTAVQIWRQIPGRYDSLIHAHDGLHAPSHLSETGAKRDLSGHEEYPAQMNTTTASNEGLVYANGSVRKRHASSLLVFSVHGLKMPGFVGARLIRVPINGRISITELGLLSRGIRLVEDEAMAGYRSRSKPFARITQRSSATTSGAAELIALGWKESNVRASWLSEIDQFNIEELDWVELEFKNIEGKMDFSAAFNALKDPHGSLSEAETIADQVKASAPRPRPRRGLVGSPTIHPDRRADIIRSITASPESKFRPQQGLVGSPTIHPDRRADIIRSITASPESKFRPQQGLVGSPTIHPDRRADIMPSVTASLDSKVRLQQDLAGDSTNHPDKKAGMVPLVAGSSYFDSKFHGRSRSSDVLDADQQTSSKSSYESSVGEIKRLRSRIMEDTGVKRRTPRIYSSPYAANIANKKSKQVSWLLDEPPQFETFAKAWQRRICRKLVLFKLWKWELNDGVPKEMWSSPASFEFINVSEISRFDKVKNLFEIYSGREWDWWPLDPPAKPLESGKVRIRWQCTCGDQRWTDTSTYLAQKCQAFVNENTAAGHESGNAASQSVGSTTSHPHPRSVVPGSFPSDTSQSTGVTSNIRSTAQAGHIQETNKSSHSKDLYVLLCIYQGSQIRHSQILASKCQNDEAFFETLRIDYRRLRGFFRFWLSPLQFSHCDFVKFTRFYVNELAKVGHSLPIDLVYQYNPRPPGPHEDPPISPHEFRRRFYTHFANPCGRDEVLERIPKRQKRFQINLHVDGREDMWGLHVELRPCFLVVLMWQIVITAGGWAFMGWWLSRHKGDLQNAAVPVTLIVTAVMALWAPIRRGMTEAL